MLSTALLVLMPLFYWMIKIAAGLLLSLAYFTFDCLLRPVCEVGFSPMTGRIGPVQGRRPKNAAQIALFLARL